MGIGFLDDCRHDGWDGPGSFGVPEAAVRRARALLDLLPAWQDRAAVAPGGDGSVGIEYPLPDGEIWIDVERDGRVRILLDTPAVREELVFRYDDREADACLKAVLEARLSSDPQPVVARAADPAGSTFESFLVEQGIRDEVHAEAARRVAAWQERHG